MIVTQQTNNLPRDADPSDFKFLHELVDELKHMPLKSKVFFPTDNKGMQPAEINCTMKYDKDGKACGEFRFDIESLFMEMAHTAIVSCVVSSGSLVYQLQIRPCRRLRSNGHKTSTSVHASIHVVALFICSNYAPGSAGRKVLHIAEETQAA